MAAGRREQGTGRTLRLAGRTCRHAPSRLAGSQPRNPRAAGTSDARISPAAAERVVRSWRESPGSGEEARLGRADLAARPRARGSISTHSKTRCLREVFFETQRRACRNREIQRRTGVPRITARRAGFARRTRFHRFVVWSFARRGEFADDLIIPAGVIALGKREGNIAAND